MSLIDSSDDGLLDTKESALVACDAYTSDALVILRGIYLGCGELLIESVSGPPSILEHAHRSYLEDSDAKLFLARPKDLLCVQVKPHSFLDHTSEVPDYLTLWTQKHLILTSISCTLPI